MEKTLQKWLVLALGTNLVLFLGRILYAVALTIEAQVAQLWVAPEDIGSVAWAYRALIRLDKSLPYLVWGTVAGTTALLIQTQYAYRKVRIVFLIIGGFLWAHRTQLGIFSISYWRDCWILELLWIAVFFPLLWYMPLVLKQLETKFVFGGEQ